uniref:Uncharacterized protein n=1 Tax=blood disease bacterium R229 TaxID=741978 RepID=G2ZVT3_9RALS|nr:conserved hypothetical protein [blood disease bacterium R229]
MIAVVMCDYNGTERQTARLQEAEHRLRVAGIDHGSHAAIVKCPNIIVGKRSDRLYGKRHTTLDHARLLFRSSHYRLAPLACFAARAIRPALGTGPIRPHRRRHVRLPCAAARPPGVRCAAGKPHPADRPRHR